MTPRTTVKRVARLILGTACLVSAQLQATDTADVAEISVDGTAKYEPPRTAGGKPDFTGVWQVLNTANYNIEVHGPQAAMAMRDGPVVPVPAKEVVALGAVGAVPASLGVVEGNEIPYTSESREKRDENRRNWLSSDPEIKCYLPGVPRATYMPFPFQIVHNEDALFFSYEYAGAVRNIFLADPGPAPIDSWMGQSWARWEGDTLVIETTGLNDRTWLDRAGNFHSDALKVTERLTLISDHNIHYQATLEDHKVYTRPWKISMPLYRRVGADARIMQFNCAEFVEEMMYGHLRREPLD
ncbi:MAG: hypothetical protein HOC23_00380 [Halieaceae bacterium]|jgi:hypothetical protein|nr:hypothetical protein [Halieaceae bacterium]